MLNKVNTYIQLSEGALQGVAEAIRLTAKLLAYGGGIPERRSEFIGVLYF